VQGPFTYLSLFLKKKILVMCLFIDTIRPSEMFDLSDYWFVYLFIEVEKWWFLHSNLLMFKEFEIFGYNMIYIMFHLNIYMFITT
jgi:hypothetical protein